MGPKRKRTVAKKVAKTQEPRVLEDCTICFDKCPNDFGELKCEHAFCFECIHSWSKKENTCPLCKARFSFIMRNTKDEDNNKIQRRKIYVSKCSQSDQLLRAAREAYNPVGILNLLTWLHDDDDDDDDEYDPDEDDMDGYHFTNIFTNHMDLTIMQGRNVNFIEQDPFVIDLTEINEPVNMIEHEQLVPPRLTSSTRNRIEIDLVSDNEDIGTSSGQSCVDASSNIKTNSAIEDAASVIEVGQGNGLERTETKRRRRK